MERILRALRIISRYYPYRKGQQWLLSATQPFFEPEAPLWLVAPAFERCPALELDAATSWHRKVFFFPRAYARFYYDAKFAAFLRLSLAPGSLFIDIGSNIGMFAMLAASLVGAKGKVLAFEPEPTSFAALSRSVALNGLSNVRCINLALSDRAGSMAFYAARDGRASSLLPEVSGREGRYASTVEVEVASLGTYFEDTGLDVSRVALVKIDVEGEEERTVRGMVQTLRCAGFPPLWCEVRGPRGSTRAPNTFEGVLRRLGALGYSAFRWMDGPRPVVSSDVLKREDILFCHPARDQLSA
jgi:FkbM family methyltransferase